MASLDDELLRDAADDARAVAFIAQQLPIDLKERYTDDVLYYFLDLLCEYYAESGVFDQQPDTDGFVDIDLEAVAAHLAAKAAKEKMGTFPADELLLIVQAELDFEETLA